MLTWNGIITCEVSLKDTCHLCKVTMAVEGDAGGHRKDIPNVCAQQSHVLLQKRPNSQNLWVTQSCDNERDCWLDAQMVASITKSLVIRPSTKKIKFFYLLYPPTPTVPLTPTYNLQTNSLWKRSSRSREAERSLLTCSVSWQFEIRRATSLRRAIVCEAMFLQHKWKVTTGYTPEVSNSGN